ncbi:aldehyde dehydrogenase (NADP(+)) [Naumannella halotolerans]|uniref:2,5-dioxovalerate dehydrogenase n=1 Tax=Naumannella halotolerans TaxID=993414 RepID=A0A4R7JCZ1_9ACTN|nr:aldehyde dehydrogenase (NADP(+)) [Naumannella halotolerans]TDT34339.1 NADP-dependent aldehyde dehydrogenase [Naumannella halotolerans]
MPTDLPLSTDLSGASLIGDQPTTPSSGTFRAIDPRTGEQLEPAFAEAGPAEVERATVLAQEAFGTYRRTDPKTRAAFLESIAANIEALVETLSDRVQAETGLPAARVAGETGRTAGQLRMFAQVVRDGGYREVRIETALPDRKPLPRPDLRERKIPLGPVAVFGASNFPLAFSVAGGDTASALAAGCPVVVKGHPAHPGTSELVGRAIAAAVAEHDLPAGTFSLLQGTSHELGTALVRDPRITAVGFTGSRAGGLALVDVANSRPVPIPVYAEMSAVNPVFLLPGALADRAAGIGEDFVTSVTGSSGQLCTKPGLVFVLDDPAADEFITSATTALTGVTSAPMLTSGIAGAFADGVAATAKVDGVQTAAQGRPDESITSAGLPALFVTSGERFLAEPQLAAEMFGPAAVVVKVADVDQLRQIVRSLEGQLTATLHLTEADDALAAELLTELELLAGRVLVNGWPTGVDVGQAMVHGGPFPATSAPGTTSVGTLAIDRFLRPVVYQNVPERLLPPEIRPDNPFQVPRQES